MTATCTGVLWAQVSFLHRMPRPQAGTEGSYLNNTKIPVRQAPKATIT
jgi:hypothetical protein